MANESIIDLSNKQPRAFLRVSLGVGTQSTGSTAISVLILANAIAATPWAGAASVRQVFTEEEVIAGAGSGSEAHRSYRAAAKANENMTAYIGVIPESVGAKAALTITLAGAATEPGTLRVRVLDHEYLVPFDTGDTFTDVHNAAAALVTEVSESPVTAAGGATLVLTAKQNGPRGNTIRAAYEFVEGGAGLTLTPSTGVYLAGGTTNDDPAATLAIAAAQRFNLIVSPYSTVAEATPILAVANHVRNEAEPLPGHRGRFVMATVADLATAVLLATATVNRQRGQIAWSNAATRTPSELAAVLAAELAAGLAVDRAYNFDGEIMADVSPQWEMADRPTPPEINAALQNGLTPLGVVSNDVTIIRSITSFSVGTAGAKDFRVLDTHYVDVPDFIADELETNFSAAFKGFKLGVDIEGEVPPPGVATKNTVRNWALGLIGPMDNVLIENFDTVTVSGSRFTRNEVAKGRVDAVIPIDVIELFHQFAGDVRQVG